LRAEGFLDNAFFVEHQMQLISDYGFKQIVIPYMPTRWMNRRDAGEASGEAAELAGVILKFALRKRRPIVLHDIYVHRSVYYAAVAAGWPQALIFRPLRHVADPVAWLRTVAPAISVVFWLGRPGYERRAKNISIFGVDDVVRQPLRERSLWEGDSARKLRVVVTAGGGGRPDSETFLNTAIAAVDILSRRRGRNVEAQIVTGPFYRGQVRIPRSSPAEVALIGYLPPFYSVSVGTSVVVAQAGYNTFHELGRSAVPHVLVPGDQYVGGDDQPKRAATRAGEHGVYVAACDPADIAKGIEAVSAEPVRAVPSAPRRCVGAWQIASLLEVMADA
jgi:hypothetical protein